MSSRKLIYIVDDQADYRFLLQQLFSHYLPTYSTYFLAGGQALLHQLATPGPKPSLILLDRHMPGLDGHQTLMLLKAHTIYRRIPVVMMSAEASRFEITDCYEAGVNSFLRKQVDFEAMKAMLTTLCHYWLETNEEPLDA